MALTTHTGRLPSISDDYDYSKEFSNFLSCIFNLCNKFHTNINKNIIILSLTSFNNCMRNSYSRSEVVDVRPEPGESKVALGGISDFGR